jgi:hypothetical protein
MPCDDFEILLCHKRRFQKMSPPDGAKQTGVVQKAIDAKGLKSVNVVTK